MYITTTLRRHWFYSFSSKPRVNYSIDSIKDLNNLIFHLEKEKYPLLTQKAVDFYYLKSGRTCK